MIVVDCEQRSPQWLALRRGVISASNADRLATPAKMKEYALELAAERLVRELPANVVTPAMQWGIDHEEQARIRYAFETNNDVFGIGFAFHDDFEWWAGCSPDGLIRDSGLVEIKCPSSKKHLEYITNAVVPPGYIAQLDGQLWVTGREWCDFVSYDPRFVEGADYFCVRHYRDMETIVEVNKRVHACAALVEKHLTAVAKIRKGAA
jgi:putative phage-type endonuclease